MLADGYPLVVLDSVFSGGDDADAQFHAASQLTRTHWLDLQRVVQRRVLRYFRTQGRDVHVSCR